jgi:hypothetical protein
VNRSKWSDSHSPITLYDGITSDTMIPAAQLVATVVGGATGEPGWAVSACRVVVRHRAWEEHSYGFPSV